MAKRLRMPLAVENPDGLHKRYEVSRLGGPTDPDAFYFVLRLDDGGKDRGHIHACRCAAEAYIKNAPPHLHRVAAELKAALVHLGHKMPPDVNVGAADYAALKGGCCPICRQAFEACQCTGY